MELVRLVGVCATNTCPTIYVTDAGDVAVQGYQVSDPPLRDGLPAGEAVVTIPRSLIMEAAQRLALEHQR